MGISNYVRVVQKWLWLILVGTIVTFVVSYLVSVSMAPVYRASTTLLVNQAQSTSSLDYNSLLTSERLTKTYSELIKKRPVLMAVIDKLALNFSPETLKAMIDVRVVRDTQLLELSIENTDPYLASSLANELADTFISLNREGKLGQVETSQSYLKQQLSDLEKEISSTTRQLDALKQSTDSDFSTKQTDISRLQANLSQYQVTYAQLLKNEQDMRLAESKSLNSISVVEPAVDTFVPVRPKVLLNTLLAGLAGLLVTLALAFIFEYFDDSIKAAEDLESATGLPALGAIMRIKGATERERLAVDLHPKSPIAEAYRVLRTNITFALAGKQGNAILVTSANPSEGKTTTAANLAVVLAQAGSKVIAVDSDLRRPTLHKFFGLSNIVGLTSLLVSPAPVLDSYLQPSGIHGLRILSSGPLPPNPSELLGSKRMTTLIERLKQEADIVLFDSPPVLGMADATVLGSRVDGIVLVVNSGRTGVRALNKARELLGKGTITILGAILNRVSMKSSGYGYIRYYTHAGDESNSFKDGFSDQGRQTALPSAFSGLRAGKE